MSDLDVDLKRVRAFWSLRYAHDFDGIGS